jgi:hypothetical protein
MKWWLQVVVIQKMLSIMYWAYPYYLVINGIAPILVDGMVWWQLYAALSFLYLSMRFQSMYIYMYTHIYKYTDR